MSQPMASSQASDGEVSTAVSLQPMGVTDILDSMFTLYRNHFRLFAKICSVYFVIALAAYLLDGISALLVFSVSHLNILSGVGGAVPWVTSLVAILALLVVTGAVFFGVTQVYLGKRVTADAAFRQTKRRFWSLFFSALLYGIVIIPLILLYYLGWDFPLDLLCLGWDLPFLCEIYLPETADWVIDYILLLAALYVGLRWIFCSLAAVFEEKSAVQSLKRSGELVKGAWWRVFGIVIGIVLLTTFILSILPLSWGLISGVTDGRQAGEQVPQEDENLLEKWMGMFEWESPELTSWRSLAQYAIWSCLDLAMTCLILPIGVIGIALVYFDRRIRKEGFDIEMRLTNEEILQ